jgi:hypothetical protein
MKKFQPHGDLSQIFRIGIADHEKIVGANAPPCVPGLHYASVRTRRSLRPAARHGYDQSQQDCNKNLHNRISWGMFPV